MKLFFTRRCPRFRRHRHWLNSLDVDVDIDINIDVYLDKDTDIDLTNRFHFAVRLFSYISQMTSKCGMNKRSCPRAEGEWVTDVHATF